MGRILQFQKARNFPEKRHIELKPLKTINEAAELLSVSPWSIRKWIKKGRLQPVRICRRVHLEEAEIERFVAEAKGDTGSGRSQIESDPTENSNLGES